MLIIQDLINKLIQSNLIKTIFKKNNKDNLFRLGFKSCYPFHNKKKINLIQHTIITIVI